MRFANRVVSAHKAGFAVSPQPANVRKDDDLHQSGYPNYQLHYLGSGLHFSCPNPNGQLMVPQAGGCLRKTASGFLRRLMRRRHFA